MFRWAILVHPMCEYYGSSMIASHQHFARAPRQLEQEGAITSEWNPAKNNRRAHFYRLTRVGRRLLEAEKHDWEQTAASTARFFEVKAQDLA
jgi:DNA-binding PadR family transcriptional regulator